MILQVIVNKFLSLDPDVTELILPLENKMIAIDCSDFPSQKIYCTFSAKSILLSSSVPEHIDTYISSSLSGFVKFAATKQNIAIQISGDIKVAEQLQELMLKLNIDWEDALANYTGDIFAYQACCLFKQVNKYQSDSRFNLEEMITEYLQEESGLLPTHCEVNDFIQAVDELRLSVDRLDARIKVYESN